MIDRKKIAEKLRKIAEDCAISGSIAVNKTNAALYAAADELDPNTAELVNALLKAQEVNNG